MAERIAKLVVPGNGKHGSLQMGRVTSTSDPDHLRFRVVTPLDHKVIIDIAIAVEDLGDLMTMKEVPTIFNLHKESDHVKA